VILEGQLEKSEHHMGIVADAVSQVMDLAAADIREVPEFGTRVQVNYLLGMAQLGKKFALLLDVDKVLSTDELLNLDQVSAIAGSTDAEVAKGAPSEDSDAVSETSASGDTEILDAV